MAPPLDVVLEDSVVRAVYLLYAGERGLREDAPETLVQFCCWLIVSGRHDIAHPIVIARAVIVALTTPDTSGTHALMSFVARAQSHPPPPAKLPGFYYTRAVPALRLAPFLGPGDFANLPSFGTDSRNNDPDELTFIRELASGPMRADCPSVSIIGFHRSVLGLGEDARSMFRALISAGISAELIDVSPPSLESSEEIEPYKPFEASRPSGEALIFCMPPFEMMRTIANLALEAGRSRQYRIGYWAWETTSLRSDWLLAADHVDEIWAMSHFLKGVYESQCGTKPVIYMPPHIDEPSCRIPGDLAPMFSGGFSFLSIFDFNSRIERKNPLGLIRAFKAAFPDGAEPVRLVLKTLNQEKHPEQFAEVMSSIGADERIILIDGPLHQSDLNGLISLADAYVSLHRSEGFGRTMAEAMRLGVPVIGTGWSGPADYLDETTGYPIDSIKIPVADHQYPFAAGEWADPDLDQAASAFRSVVDNWEQASGRSERANARISQLYSRHAVANLLRARLLQIGTQIEAS
ncbi:glycosyltransferase [Bradyrhizobium sp. HKCCYLR20261]|uniref:glycosyltransferase n=1 Tax=Bradyrhizobium sp. HKCCYLR20261 TaxID=3420760 RepID=UPI003EBFD4CE